MAAVGTRRLWSAGLALVVLAVLGALVILASDREPLVLNARERSRLPGKFVALSHGFTNYEIMGPANGPVIVLVPGISVPRTIFVRMLAPLAESGYRVIVYDLYGRGYSDRPRVRYDAALFNRQIDDLVTALRIDGPINLVGLASGGLQALLYAEHRPARVESLVLICPDGVDAPLGGFVRLLRQPLAGELAGRIIMNAVGQRRWEERLQRYSKDPGVVDDVIGQFRRQLVYKGFWRALTSSIASLPISEASDLFRRVERQGTPTMVLWGADDVVIPTQLGHEIRRLMPSAQYVEIPAGHLPQYERPDLTHDAIRGFLAGVHHATSRSTTGRRRSVGPVGRPMMSGSVTPTVGASIATSAIPRFPRCCWSSSDKACCSGSSRQYCPRPTRLARSILRSAARYGCFPRAHQASVLTRGQLMRSVTESNTREVARYSRCPAIDGLEVMSARWVQHSFAPHMHDFYAVSLNYRGRGAFDCRRELHHATPGTCNLLAPGELHTGRAACGDGWIYRNLHVEAPLMVRLLESIEWRGSCDVSFTSSLVSDSVLAARLARVFASMTESSSLLQNESLLLSVVARLITDHFVDGHALVATGREHAAVSRAKEWLDANFEQNVSIRSLARFAGLSPYYLVRAFHAQVGVPPHRYQTIVRVHRARRLLTSGESLSEVAFRTGFCDQSHLTRCFKRTLGVTPGSYAASHIEPGFRASTFGV